MFTSSVGRSLSVLAVVVAGLAASGCASDTSLEEDDDSEFAGGGDDGESDEVGEGQEAISTPGNWKAPASVVTAGLKAKFGYQGASGRCAGNMLAGTKALGRYIKGQFARNIASPGDGLPAVQGYNCRTVRGSSSPSMHGMGRALDVFVPRSGGKADNTKGDPIANWAVEHAAELGIQMVIWDRSVWSVKTHQVTGYGGKHGHDDHVHIEVTKAAASKQLAWYSGR